MTRGWTFVMLSAVCLVMMKTSGTVPACSLPTIHHRQRWVQTRIRSEKGRALDLKSVHYPYTVRDVSFSLEHTVSCCSTSVMSHEQASKTASMHLVCGMDLLRCFSTYLLSPVLKVPSLLAFIPTRHPPSPSPPFHPRPFPSPVAHSSTGPAAPDSPPAVPPAQSPRSSMPVQVQ